MLMLSPNLVSVGSGGRISFSEAALPLKPRREFDLTSTSRLSHVLLIGFK